jgi:two-component system cell cycle response regulator CtrA
LPPPSAGPSGREIVADNLALKAALGVTNDFPREIGGAHFTPQEAAILEALLKRAQMSRAGLLIASHDPMSGEDERDEKIVDVFICRIRKKLEPIGVKILTSGGAFSIDLGDKAKLRAAIAAARGGAV